MVAVLLAGGPGAGKSAVASALHARGLCSVDLDFGYARHEDAAGDPVAFPASPDLAWLSTHYWQWLDDRLTNALDQYRSRNALFCGTAYNMFDHLDRFALIILLRLTPKPRPPASCPRPAPTSSAQQATPPPGPTGGAPKSSTN